ncbi:MAG TPA: flagellum-specific ATP synthase FliI, partial [Bacteroidetes bacterium]|nr:flagellum-specific ATP synthase FliI [Bacteroidota bacterium]
MTLLDKMLQTLPNLNTVQSTGRVLRITGTLIEASGPAAGVGELCRIATSGGSEPCMAEVIAFHGS